MGERMSIYYDELEDYFIISNGELGVNYEEEIQSGIIILRDKKTDKVIGIGIRDFLEKTRLKSIELNLPFKISLKQV